MANHPSRSRFASWLNSGVSRQVRSMKIQFLLSFLMCTACHAAPAPADHIVFLGDDARLALVANCGNACAPHGNDQIKTPSRGSSASDAANTAQAAKHGVLVLDAASGPLPITRAHILIARQAGVPALSVLVVNTSALDGLEDKSELIELEIAEVRELLNKYEMHGDTAEVFFDQAGLKDLISKSVPLPPRASRIPNSSQSDSVSAFIYNLSAAESDRAESIAQGKKVIVWINGQTVKSDVHVGATIEPGGLGQIDLRFDTPTNVAPGTRFFIERDNKIVSAGVITSIDV